MSEIFANRFRSLCLVILAPSPLLVRRKLFDCVVHRKNKAADQLGFFIWILLKSVVRTVVVPVEYALSISVQQDTS